MTDSISIISEDTLVKYIADASHARFMSSESYKSVLDFIEGVKFKGVQTYSPHYLCSDRGMNKYKVWFQSEEERTMFILQYENGHSVA